MAGEIIGKIYEAILQVVLTRLRDKHLFSGNIFWNEIPVGISVEPDFLIGPNKDEPVCFFFVTHSGASGNSHMKTWRNIGELCEAKSVLAKMPTAISISFETIWKADLKKMLDGVFDAELFVDDRPYGDELVSWVHANVGSIPGTQEEKAEKIKELTATDSKLESLLKKLETDVESCLKKENRDLVALWSLEKARQKGVAPKAKKTYVRRGWTKRLLVGNAYNNGRILDSRGSVLVTLGIAKKHIGKYALCDDELKWFLGTAIDKKYEELARPYMSEGFVKQLEKVRSFKLLENYVQYLITNHRGLSSASGMRAALEKLYRNPKELVETPEGCEPPSNVWLYDVIAAVSKAIVGKAQGFGYSSFSAHRLSKTAKIGAMSVGEWCTCFSNQFFNRTATSVPDSAIGYLSEVLSEQVAGFSEAEMLHAKDAVLKQYLEKEYEAVLLAHRGFEPLLALARSAIPKLSKVSYRTCFAEKAGLGGAAGKTTVAQYKDVIVNWQSAYGGHSNDKRKELCGRAVGLRYTWDASAKKFKPRPGVKKLVLLLDGTWTQKDLNALVAAGWDEIYYPDEIDKLKASVLGAGKKGGVLPVLESRQLSMAAEGDTNTDQFVADESIPYGKKRIR